MTAPSQADERPPCAAGIVFAMAVEADAFARLVADAVEYDAAGLTLHEAAVAGRRVAWCVAGAGREAAARATRLLLDGHRPRLVVSAGFAGGLDPALRRGTVVLPRRAVRRGAGEPVGLAAVPGTAAGDDLVIVSEDRVVTTAAEKRGLALATAASLVDMETHTVATVARAAGVPCAGVRVISDDAGQDLPREIAALVQPQPGMRRLGAALAAIGRRPRAAADMWRLWEHSVVDGRTLAAALERLLTNVSDSPSASSPGDSSAGRA